MTWREKPATHTSLWDFALRCLPSASGEAPEAGRTPPNAGGPLPHAGHCWMAVPLTMGRLALYRLPYDTPPPAIRDAPPPAAPNDASIPST